MSTTKDYQFLDVHPTSPELLEFINSEMKYSSSFRYFQSRSVDVLKHHVITLLLRKGNQTLGYAHIDFEQKHWLGIYVSSNHRGKGLGATLISELLRRADDIDISAIHLSVDKDNSAAIKMYKKYGFEVQEEKELIYFMKRSA